MERHFMTSTRRPHHSTRRAAGQLSVAHDGVPAQKHIPDPETEVHAV
jgi:hypothetical protein